MVIYGVSFDMVGKQPIVLLKTADGNKFLPIWIGHPEAAAILMKLQGASTPRPMTHDLLTEMLQKLEARVVRIAVTELRENTFYALITVAVNGSEIEIDSRPSDAIALAVRSDAPIFADDSVIEESAIEFEHEDVNEEEVVEEFKLALRKVEELRMELPQPVGGERPAVRLMELGEECVLAALVHEVVTLGGLVLLQPAHELESAVDGPDDLEIGVGDLLSELGDERVGPRIALHQAKI